jgi:hypothetical protein
MIWSACAFKLAQEISRPIIREHLEILLCGTDLHFRVPSVKSLLERRNLQWFAIIFGS